MDVLTDILGSLRLTGGVVIDAETNGDWCLLSRFTDEDCARFKVRGNDLVAYHYVRSGHVYVAVEGQPVVEASAGDIILLPRNDSHLLYSSQGVTPVDSHDLIQEGPGGTARIVIEGEGEAAGLYCGFLGVSTEHHPLLDSLPAVMKLNGSDDVHGDWVETSMRMLNEAGNSPEMVARLSELFFAEAIRRYMEQLAPGEGGWLAGLRDSAVAKALAIIHARYAEELDVETLAREAGVSRSVLGERFVELLGEPPMRYCARWRMRVAANMLRDGKQNAANIAYAVGFNSEAAFNRAFKREFGEPPATWRRKVEEENKGLQQRARGLPEQIVQYCTAKDGTRLAFSCVGEGAPLVKAANWLNHIEHDWQSPVWRHWLQELTRGHRLVRYDERANGLSDWDTPDLSFEAFVDDLECVVDCAGLDRFDLLGISQGASVAIAYAVRHPDRVRKLILCGGYAAGWAARGDPEEVARREAMITLTEIGWGADHPAYRQLFTNLYIPGGTAKQVDWFNEVQKVSASPANAVRLQRELSKIDVRDLLDKVSVPTLIFHAKGDQVVPFPAGEYLAKHIPGAVFVPLISENHILLEGEPAWRKFVQLTRQFLRDGDKVPASPAPPKIERGEAIEQIRARDGTKLAYALTGDGFPLVKMPNWITHLELDRTGPVYRHWIAEGSRRNCFLRWDMRGFGMSEWNPPRFDFEAMLEDVEDVTSAAAVGKCDVLGISHGAALGIAFAARHPERVRRLILVNAFAAGWRVRADPEELAWRNSLMEMNRREWSFRRSLLGEMFLTLYFPGADQALIDWHNRNFEKLGPADNMLEMIEVAADVDVRADLARVRAPTLVCHARQDGNSPLNVGKAVAEGIADARFVELDSANHILLGDEPAWGVFTREMRAFLGAD